MLVEVVQTQCRKDEATRLANQKAGLSVVNAIGNDNEELNIHGGFNYAFTVYSECEENRTEYLPVKILLLEEKMSHCSISLHT